MTIAHDAPNKKLIILSNLSFCIREIAVSVLQPLPLNQDIQL
jgi:hypothetical protein